MYVPQERQALLHSTTARQILYGGAAGGGKSVAVRWDGIRFALENPGFQGYLFRKTRLELQSTHIRTIQLELPPSMGLGTYSESRNAFEFKNTSVINMCYAEDMKDVKRYLSEEMHWLGIDEASTMLPEALAFLVTRVRLGGWKPKRDGGRLPRIIYATNPGGPSHSYLKAKFVDRYVGEEKVDPETMFYDDEFRDPDDPTDKGLLSIYIPAKARDNKYLDKNYSAMFSGLPSELAKAYREGDWDVVIGRSIYNLDKTKHMIPRFEPPSHWTVFTSMDFGMRAPFSWGIYCVSEGMLIPSGHYLPPGAVIRFGEWYGWNGKPNQGCGMSPQAIARRIREREEGYNISYRVADNEIFAKRGGPSVAEWFADAVPDMTFQAAEKDRRRNYNELLARLAGNPFYMKTNEVEEHPQFFVTENCTHFWRTVPILESDELDPEKGPKTKNSEDHVYDEVVYALRSRPFTTTLDDVVEAAYIREYKQGTGKGDKVPFTTIW